jgi:hypothetical protein
VSRGGSAVFIVLAAAAAFAVALPVTVRKATASRSTGPSLRAVPSRASSSR